MFNRKDQSQFQPPIQPEKIPEKIIEPVAVQKEIPLAELHPGTGKLVHPDLNDPIKNHPKKSGGLVAD